MRTIPTRHAKFILTIVLMLLARLATAQNVHIVADPDHTDPNAIYLINTHIQLDITGGVAHATLTQTFHNPNTWQAEGIYLFPLPEGAAVTDFRLTMDGKPVSGRVVAREEAKRIYTGIVRRMRDPALLEWVNNRVFQARVFPFEPNGDRTLTLSYAQVLPKVGDFRVFRYLSGLGRSEWVGRTPGRPETRSREGAFVVEGAISNDRPIRSVSSPTHPLDLDRRDENRVRFTAEGSLGAARGFAVQFASGDPGEIGLDLLAYRPRDREGYFMLSVTPPARQERDRVPHDLVFVLDVSGSMVGVKLEQAVEALLKGLDTLQPEDRFALVTFSSSAEVWGSGLVTAEPHELEQARRQILELRAQGGTDMESALLRAGELTRGPLAEDGDSDADRPVYVVLLSDGCPTVRETDPEALVGLAGAGFRQEVRLFTWGVGYDVNTYLLDSLARQHRGISEYVQQFDDLGLRIGEFFARIGSPALTDLTLAFEGVSVLDVLPRELPDLFHGTSLTIVGRYRDSGTATVRLQARRNSGSMTLVKEVSLPAGETSTAFVASIWAQRKVGYLLEQIRLNGADPELEEEVVALGEEFGLITPYTSYLVTENDLQHQRSPAGTIRFRRASSASTPLPSGGARATVSGRVVDDDAGQPLAGVNISLFDAAGPPTIMGNSTNADGEFIIGNVSPGTYNLRGSLVGYQTCEVQGLTVTAGMNHSEDIALSPTMPQARATNATVAFMIDTQRDVTATQQSYTIEEMERMAVTSTTDLLALQTNTYASTDFTGELAVLRSAWEKRMQGALRAEHAELLATRRIGEKRFRFDVETQTWKDDALGADAKFEEVEIGSEAFLDLLEKHEDLAKYTALGKRVEVKLGEKAYRFILPDPPAD